jgi:hypothetical protein
MKRREFLRSAFLAAAAAGNWPKAATTQSAMDKIPAEDVKRVLVVFKCHLDIGFTDTQANVMRTYFEQYYPQAITTAESLRRKGETGRYTWTTGSWLLYEYLEQAGRDARSRMEQAVAAGDIAWHALPFSWQTELLDRSAIEGCLGFSKALDARFGRRTIAGKMTDVPGHSRGIVSILAANGVELLDVGVNPASTPPEVPAVFVWKEPQGSSIVALYHHHDYGGIIRIPRSDLAIDVEVRVDNSGPHTEKEIEEIYAKLKREFPNAEIKAANLSEVAVAVNAERAKLPVFTEEIGDTWIYGAPSDPMKIARYRELARLRLEWIGANKLAAGDATDREFLRRLVLAVEHTWGTDTKRYIDHDHYSPRELAEYIGKPNYQVMEHSWQEKRDDIDAGVANLPPALRAEALGRLKSLCAVEPDTTGLEQADPHAPIHTAHFEVAIDPATGAITKLIDKRNKHDWASPAHPLAMFAYQTLTQADYTDFLHRYVLSKEWWAPQDFGKPNLERFPAESKSWTPTLKRLCVGTNAESDRVIAELAIHDVAAEQRGLVAWPNRMYLELQFPKADPVVKITFYALAKAANRMPESMWLTFVPNVPAGARWTLDKVDQEVRPSEVVRGGARRMHAVTNRITCVDGNHRLMLTTFDAPVVALGARSPLNFSEELPDLSEGIHVNLFNNAWGTNYPQWAGGDWMYRFVLTV